MVSFKKPLISYSAGFILTMLIPQKYFIGVISKFYDSINQNIIVLETKDYYKFL